MKKDSLYIIFFILGVFLFLGVISLPGKINENKANKCEICHKNEKMEGKSYCWSCYMDAYTKVKNQDNSSTGNGSTYYKKTSSISSSSSSYSSNTTSATNSYKSTSSSFSKKKDYSDLEFDPIDYDDPDEYAEDAWEIDFDDYDDAYDYWEDY